MAYAIGMWISVSVGFLLGAARGRLGEKNKQFDQHHDYETKELYPNTNQGDL